jgi:hypothetical protein
MNPEHLKRQELFRKTPEEKALLKKLKSEYKKKVKNEPKKG